MRKGAVGLAIGLASWLAVAGMSALGLLDEVELASYDRRLIATHDQDAAREDIVIVEINESTLSALEPVYGRWPWPRAVHGAAIDYLARAGARVIAYDILFIEHDRRSAFPLGDRLLSGAESDEALVTSVGRAGNVILAASALFEGLLSEPLPSAPAPPPPGPAWAPGGAWPVRPYLTLPIEPLANVSAGVGHSAMAPDADGTARRVLPFIEAQGRVVPWLGTGAALMYAGLAPEAVRREGDRLRVGEAALALEPGGSQVLRMHGPWVSASGRHTYDIVSFYDVLRAEEAYHAGETPAINPSIFRDKLVFVGLSALSENDVHTSPFGGPVMPGVQWHAAAADDLLSRQSMRRASRATDMAVTAGASVGAGVLATVLPVGWALLVIVPLGAAIAWVLTAAVGQGQWIAAVAPILAMALAAFGGTAWQYFVEGRQKRLMKSLFGRYVSPDVFAHLMAAPDVARLGGDRRTMSVLFSDIRGFTTASEQTTPEAVVAQLNEYFSAMVQVLFRHQGTLDKFVGDMVMGLFGAPVADPKHAEHAVAAAIEMVETLDRLNKDWQVRGMPRLDIGIGVNSGEMIAGNIGSDTVMSYTVIGDAVNLGARLESLNKEYGTTILISEATRRLLTIDAPVREVGPVTVKGRTTAVVVYAVDVARRREGAEA